MDLRNWHAMKLRVSSWKRGLEVSRWNGCRWMPESADPGIPLLGLRENDKDDEPLRAFTDGIPKVVRDAVRPIRYCQTLVLRLLRVSPENLDLVRAVPILALMVGAGVDRGLLTFEDGVGLLSCSRREILAKLVGARSKAAVRLAQRFRPKIYDDLAVLLLIRVLARPSVIHLLRHCPQPSVEHLHMALAFPEILQTRPGRSLLQEEAILSDAAEVKRLVEHLRIFGRALGIVSAEHTIARSRDIRSLRRLFDRWLGHLGGRDVLLAARERGVKLDRVFPPPPIPGTDHIRPITSPVDLLHEGNEMQHCVASLAKVVVWGRYYVYQVHAPERATLGLVVFRDDLEAEIDDLRLCGDMPASHATWAEVILWITSASWNLSDSDIDPATTSNLEDGESLRGELEGAERPRRRDADRG